MVHAKDRIGQGPWFNAKNQQIAASLAALHTSVQVPHPHNPNTTLTITLGVPSNLMFDEKGAAIPGNDHDILTGSNPFGEATFSQVQMDALFGTGSSAATPNCNSWTDGSPGNNNGASVVVGHSDWQDYTGFARSWNFSHGVGCTAAALKSTAGSGRLYCFAIN